MLCDRAKTNLLNICVLKQIYSPKPVYLLTSETLGGDDITLTDVMRFGTTGRETIFNIV